MPVSSATLGYPHEVIIPLDGDHTSIVKFSSIADNNYIVVSKTIAWMARERKGKFACEHRLKVYVTGGRSRTHAEVAGPHS